MATTTTHPEVSLIPNDPQGFRRRDFIRTGAGLVLGLFLHEGGSVSEAEAANNTKINSWLTIGSDESITLVIGSTEMGQGSFTGLAQILAEELIVDFAKVQTVQGGPTLVTPAPIGTSINTVGSGVVRNNFWKLRDAAATARDLLLQAAMKTKGDSNPSNYTFVGGAIRHSSNTVYTYGQLAATAQTMVPKTGVPVIPDSQFKIIGKTVNRVDIPSKVDGSAKYGIDIRLPNMLYAIVKHGPCFGATLASTPSTPGGAKAVVPLKVSPGTGRGTEVDGAINAVAVVGYNTWDTWQAANSLNAKWNLPANANTLNDAQFIAQGQALLTNAAPYVAGGTNGPGTLYTVEGNAATAKTGIAAGTKHLAEVYTLPYVSHACMEVLNCTVDYVPGVKCEVYAPTQSAKSVLALVTNLTQMPESQVTIHTTYLGGGLGRKAETDFVGQAVQIAMQVKQPVKLMWPREQDFTRDQYRPMAVVQVSAGLDNSGHVTGWAYRNVSPSILGQRNVPLPATGDSQGYEAAQGLPYNFGARVTEWVSHPSPIPVGFWRSVGASINTFAVESMIDELAVLAGQDPYLFRRGLLTDPRWIAVLDAAAKLAGWSTPSAGVARGIAIGKAFNSIVAEVVEISGSATSFRVNKVSIALDCYLTVNPGQVQAQLVGGMVHGLNAALYGRQSFVNGAAQAKNFSHSRMIRGGEMPSVNVTLIPNPSLSDRTIPIGGVGELGVPTFAPALANAYFKLTGKRQRSLPFFPNATMSD